jgi:hypothetical protein
VLHDERILHGLLLLGVLLGLGVGVRALLLVAVVLRRTPATACTTSIICRTGHQRE